MKLMYSESIVLSHIRRWAFIYRQVFATVAAFLLSLSGGINIGHSAVLLPQLAKDKSFPYDKTFDSLIASIPPIAMVVGCIFAGSMCDWIGRKKSLVVLTVPFTIGWIILGLSINNTFILVSRFITGLCFGVTKANSVVYIAELTDPKYRAIALVCPTLASYIGILISHIVGKFIYWRRGSFVFAIPNLITLIILNFLKESPLWLLNNGKIDEGIESFILYRGKGESSDRELTVILRHCQEKTENPSFRDILNLLFSRVFMKSLTTAFLLFLAAQGCGVNTIPYYFEYVFPKKLSGDIDAFLLMIILDCIRIIATLVMCIFAKYFPQNKTFFVSGFVTCLTLICVIIYLFLSPTGLSWLALICIIIYMASGTAVTTVAWSFIGEIFPGEVRALGSAVGTAISSITQFISVKITPGIVTNFGDIAMYSSFAAVTLVSCMSVMFMLPNTKGRTLQDIEDSMYNKNKCHVCNNIDATTTATNSTVQI